MGFFSDILGAAAPIVGGIFGGPVGASIGGAVGGLLGSKSAPSSTTTTQQQQLDPRIQSMLFGGNGDPGLLDQYKGMLTQPAGAQAYQGAANDYLSQYGSQDLGAVRGAATGLMSGQSAPQMSAAPQIGAAQVSTPTMNAASSNLLGYSVGNKVQAPSQNGMDLTGSYQNLLSGGDTTALNNSMNNAVAATNAGFKTNQDNVTNSLMRTVLPSIRSNSVLAGQYGGSRQGIAEGNAISDYTNQLTNANTQLGATNSANTTAQAAQAYQQGQDRALSATQGLGAQQYGVASQDANTKNQAEFMNVNNLWDASKTNAGFAQQAGMANLGAAQQANLANQGTTMQANLANQGVAQQTNLANQGAQLSTNSMNNGAALGGAGLLGGLGSTAMGAANSDLTRAQGVNGLLAPYMTANAGSTSTSPLYQNTAGNMLGGATAALGLYNQLNGSNTYNNIRNNDNYGVNTGSASVFNTPSSASTYTPPTTMAMPSLSGLWG